jgi:hypothetical protein
MERNGQEKKLMAVILEQSVENEGKKGREHSKQKKETDMLVVWQHCTCKGLLCGYKTGV